MCSKFGTRNAIDASVPNLGLPIFPPTGTSRARQASKEAQRRFDAVTQYLAEKVAAEAEIDDKKTPQMLEQRPRTPPAREGSGRRTAGGDSAHGLVNLKRFRGGENEVFLRSFEAVECWRFADLFADLLL